MSRPVFGRAGDPSELGQDIRGPVEVAVSLRELRQPDQGFAAESTAASILYVAGFSFGAPISTTHTITSAIMGVGATKRLSAVRWSVAGSIVGAWVLTFPGAGLLAAGTYWLSLLVH